MFQIKICGITSLQDAKLVADSAADAIGLNFFPQSPRYVSESTAKNICEFAEGRLLRVGVFVNAPVEEIERLRVSLALDLVQLHGDEPPEVARRFPDDTVVRAVRCRQHIGGNPLKLYLDMDQTSRFRLAAVLVDAYRSGQYGGTGEVVDWEAVRSRKGLGRWPIVLAGGLTADNIGQAIRQARPDAVDTASGVEWRPGCKDPEKIRLFAQRASRAFANG